MGAVDLRPYQEEARRAVEREWDEGRAKTLLVLPLSLIHISEPTRP